MYIVKQLTTASPRRYPKTVIPTEARRLFPSRSLPVNASAREVEGSSSIANGWPNPAAIDQLIHERLADSEKNDAFSVVRRKCHLTFSHSVVFWGLMFLRLRAVNSALFFVFKANINLS